MKNLFKYIILTSFLLRVGQSLNGAFNIQELQAHARAVPISYEEQDIEVTFSPFDQYQPMIDISTSTIVQNFDVKDRVLLIGSQEMLPLQVVPMEQSPSPNSVEVRLVFPQPGSFEKSQTIRSQIRLIGFPLGIKTYNSSAPKLRESRYGQNMRVIIDNEPYFIVNLDAEDSADANLDVYRKTLSFTLPKTLANGQHIMRVFPVLSYGESLKKKNNFDAAMFYKMTRSPTIQQDLTKPYLTYNDPQGDFVLKNSNEPILLDFYICNCSLAREGYKVLLHIDDEEMGKLYQWSPYLIYGLKAGSHKIKLELLGPNNERVPGDFNLVERTINIKMK
ncbi:MAG: hypothetical protein K9M07_00740 [Simkaniaceae bacterium]|nr:hypothetical protein [Simkaniaceae bacterium]